MFFRVVFALSETNGKRHDGKEINQKNSIYFPNKEKIKASPQSINFYINIPHINYLMKPWKSQNFCDLLECLNVRKRKDWDLWALNIAGLLLE